jgi:hypothetical protein
MISGTRKQDLTIDSVLSLISSYDIYRFYFGEFKLNEVTNNHLRGDRDPSFIIGNKGAGELRHYDFSDSTWRGDCFEFVQSVFGLNLNQTLRKIDQDFGLGISSASMVDYKQITGQYKQPEELGKRYCLIQAITRPFTTEELEYWNQFHQSIDDLRANNVYSIKALYLNKTKFSMSDTMLRFGYLYDGHWKIYRPYEDKRHKWIPNNVPIVTLDGKNDIHKDYPCLITKSKKDYMVLKKVYPHNLAVQNESIACFSPENLDFIRTNSSIQILGFDSDPVGVKNSQIITELLGFNYCNVPRHYLSGGIKDFAELGKVHGLEAIERVLIDKGLI